MQIFVFLQPMRHQEERSSLSDSRTFQSQGWGGRGVNRKNMRKNMTFCPLALKTLIARDMIEKTRLAKRFSEAVTSKALE